jgi:hypothetical protein
MGKFVIGFVLGIIIGMALGFGVTLVIGGTQPAPSDSQALPPAPPVAADQRVGDLTEAVDDLTAQLDRAYVEIDNMQKRLDHAQGKLEEAQAELAARAATPAPPAAEPEPEPVAETPAEPAEPPRYMGEILVTGGAVSDRIRRGLGLTEPESQAIEQALADEDRRLREAIYYEFSQDLPDLALSDLESVGLEGVMTRLVPKLMPEIGRLAELSRGDQAQMPSPMEALGDRSYLARLANLCRPARARTHQTLEGQVSPETMQALRDGPLPAGRFRLGPGMQMDFSGLEDE